MSIRTLATPEAVDSINKVAAILDGDFLSSITALKTQGTNLSEPNVWDGALAMDFRNNLWPSCTKALDEALTSLKELQAKLQTIQNNIATAGGGH